MSSRAPVIVISHRYCGGGGRMVMVIWWLVVQVERVQKKDQQGHMMISDSETNLAGSPRKCCLFLFCSYVKTMRSGVLKLRNKTEDAERRLRGGWSRDVRS